MLLHAEKTKQFAARLNKCLDELEVPSEARERSAILSKMLQITRQQARMLLDGHQAPDEYLLNRIEQEFEVELSCLLTKTKK